MSLTPLGMNQVLKEGVKFDEISLHSADPTDDGSANELVGADYARQPIASWKEPANKEVEVNGLVRVQVHAGNLPTHYAIWKAGVCMDTDVLPAVGTYPSGGFVEIPSLKIQLALPA